MIWKHSTIFFVLLLAFTFTGCGSISTPVNPPIVHAAGTGPVTYMRAQITTPVINPQDVACLSGSDTKTVQITAWDVSGFIPNGTVTKLSYGSIIVRSSPDIGGQPTILSGIAADTADAPTNSTAQFISGFASAPTLGNKYGLLSSVVITLPGEDIAATDGVTHMLLAPITLHGSQQSACLNFAGDFQAGAALINRLAWTEL